MHVKNPGDWKPSKNRDVCVGENKDCILGGKGIFQASPWFCGQRSEVLKRRGVGISWQGMLPPRCLSPGTRVMRIPKGNLFGSLEDFLRPFPSQI